MTNSPWDFTPHSLAEKAMRGPIGQIESAHWLCMWGIQIIESDMRGSRKEEADGL